MGEIDYWDLFYIGNTTFFLFPRFKNKDYSIKLKDFYYHNTFNGYNYYLEKEDNTSYIKFNISPIYKKFQDNNKFLPCIYLQPRAYRAKNNEVSSNIVSIVKSCSSYDELMEQFIDNFYNFGEIIALYPIKYIEGIRIERSMIIDDIISNTNFIDMFSNKLICERKFNTNGWLNSHKYNVSIESCNLGWLKNYKKDLISRYKTDYLLCSRDPSKKDLYFMQIK